MPDGEVTVPDGGARFQVVGGGVPGPQELAALVVALTPAGADAGVGPRTSTRDEVPAWARAALLEGVGLPSPTRPSDLARAWLAS